MGARGYYLEVCFVELVWCLVIVNIFMRSGGAKRFGDALKSLFGVTMKATRRENFYGKGGFSLCNTTVLKLYVSLTGYWKLPLFSILMLFYLFCI